MLKPSFIPERLSAFRLIADTISEDKAQAIAEFALSLGLTIDTVRLWAIDIKADEIVSERPVKIGR